MKYILALLLFSSCGIISTNAIHEIVPVVHFPLRQLFKQGTARITRDTCGAPSLLSSTKADELLQNHINFRKSEGSSNMNTLTYVDDLADRAQELANKCSWAHALTTDCAGNGIGQNLYMSWTGPNGVLPSSFNASSVVYNWADKEKPDYSYEIGSCTAVCGHYTQVAWAHTNEVGCGVKYCPVVTKPVKDSNGQITGSEDYVQNAVIVACDYRGPGNWVGQKPFLKGEACTACKFNTWASGWKCVEEQCAACDLADSDCNCPAGACENGVSTETQTGTSCSSTCECNSGYWGDGCSKPCDCSALTNVIGDSTCERYAGWGFCTHSYVPFMNLNCKKTCGCPDPNNMPSTCPSKKKRQSDGDDNDTDDEQQDDESDEDEEEQKEASL